MHGLRRRSPACACRRLSIRIPQQKGQLALARRIGDLICCEKLDPILTTPGGWGLRNPVPKGPGQRSFILVAVQHGGGLTEIRRHYDLPNVHVRLCRQSGSGSSRNHACRGRRTGRSCRQARPAKWRPVLRPAALVDFRMILTPNRPHFGGSCGDRRRR